MIPNCFHKQSHKSQYSKATADQICHIMLTLSGTHNKHHIHILSSWWNISECSLTLLSTYVVTIFRCMYYTTSYISHHILVFMQVHANKNSKYQNIHDMQWCILIYWNHHITWTGYNTLALEQLSINKISYVVHLQPFIKCYHTVHSKLFWYKPNLCAYHYTFLTCLNIDIHDTSFHVHLNFNTQHYRVIHGRTQHHWFFMHQLSCSSKLQYATLQSHAWQNSTPLSTWRSIPWLALQIYTSYYMITLPHSKTCSSVITIDSTILFFMLHATTLLHNKENMLPKPS